MANKSVRWAFNFANWQPTTADILAATSCIQPEEKERIMKFVYKRDFKASLIGRLLMRKFVYTCSNAPYNQIKFIRDERGKPILDFPKQPEINFNVSHHGGICVLAGIFGNSSVGVDVMKFECARIKNIDEYFRIMNRQFSADEWCCIRNAGSKHDQLAMFYRHWCLKESYVKAIGVGLNINLQTLSFKIHTKSLKQNELVTDTELFIEGQKVEWFFEEMLLDEEHCIAVALDNKNYIKKDNLCKFISFEQIIESSCPLLEQDTNYCDRFFQKEE